ncbi:hypothetical protein B4O97_08605 [Marispirochaeta aestuarii]|uniref:C4-dicarboxylate ABC transporter substrate-binding protein n=1 Tax=Marispirochaeta aestuarii TaxID=1963862 RepID=A0A1Y1RYQ1_9SPIO|nr:TRAP transporter substrate-binding protein DctP [Marispirochaeta aestuarii]ORC35693.1 hypothetical protein B4O97_08605 [Marispirochaeta aestuarii]
MLKRILKLAMVSLCLFLITGIPLLAEGQKDGADEKPITLKLGHVAPESEPYHLAAVKFAELVEERTDGMVKINIFPNSQLGAQRDMIEGLQMGTVDITLTTSAVLANFVPTSQVIELPFMFRSRDHVYSVVDGPLAKEIYKGAEDQGLKVISTWENGFRNITNNVRPVSTPSDMDGIKIRVMENQMYIDMFNALGANPVPIARSELFTALQQGTVDAQENPMGQIYSSRFYEVQDYVTLSRHTYSPEVVVFSLKNWNKIPSEYQSIILKAAEEARDYCRKMKIEKDDEFIEGVKKEGMQVTELTPEQVSMFQDKMKPVWTKYYKVIGEDLIQKVYNYR